MKRRRPSETTRQFEEALAKPKPDPVILCLYVTGATPRSARAINNIKRICEEQVPGSYELEVVDLYQQPEAAEANQIVAAPTLIKRLPPPFRKMVGDLSNEGYVLLALGIKPATHATD